MWIPRHTALNLFSPTVFLFFFPSYLCFSPFLLSPSSLLHLPSVSHPYSRYIYFPISHYHIIYHFQSNNPFTYCLLPPFLFFSFFPFLFPFPSPFSSSFLLLSKLSPSANSSLHPFFFLSISCLLFSSPFLSSPSLPIS
jgi:hypothetical protein